jgi:AcrR family transcriptional regulator
MDTHDITRLGLEQLLSIEDLAAYLGVPRQTIYDWRVDRRGPRALKAKLAERIAVSPLDTPLTADSSFFTDLVEYWLADLDLEARLAIATREAYERNMRNLVLPSFAELALREIGWRGATPSSSTRRGGATTVHDRPGW